MKHWRLVYLLIPFTFAVFGLMLWCNSVKAETVENGAAVYRSAPAETEAETAPLWEEYVEGEGEPPVWWDPDEPMAIEWEDHFSGVGKMVEGVTDINVGDINVPCNAQQSDIVRYNAQPVYWDPDETLYGWNGHSMEQWELSLFARIFYLEFYGTSLECCEAGCDAFLNLWDSGYFGDTMYGLLSATTEDGRYVYSTYAYVWDWEYDSDGLAWCLDFCRERFEQGPEWCAVFFRTDYYHQWAVPCYCFPEDNVYFSTGKGWN